MLSRIIDFFIPPRCLICGEKTETDNTLCADCFKKIRFITPPVCRKCGRPIEGPERLLCPDCLHHKSPIEKWRSAVYYNQASKKIILPFKHGDRTELAFFMAREMKRAGQDLFPDTDIIIPVPVHLRKLFKRKYNQSSLLGLSLSKQTGIPFSPYLLRKTKYGPSQEHKNAKERKQNVADTFSVPHPEKIKGKRILILDDVLTTGATLTECAKMLKKAGAKEIFALTFARVLKE